MTPGASFQSQLAAHGHGHPKVACVPPRRLPLGDGARVAKSGWDGTKGTELQRRQRPSLRLGSNIPCSQPAEGRAPTAADKSARARMLEQTRIFAKGEGDPMLGARRLAPGLGTRLHGSPRQHLTPSRKPAGPTAPQRLPQVSLGNGPSANTAIAPRGLGSERVERKETNPRYHHPFRVGLDAKCPSTV